MLSKFLTKDEHFKVYKDYGVIAINEKLAFKDYMGAANVMIECKLTSQFDPFETIQVLLEKPANNGKIKSLIDCTTKDA